MAAKRTSEWIPLCHNGVGLESVRVTVDLVGPGVAAPAVVEEDSSHAPVANAACARRESGIQNPTPATDQKQKQGQGQEQHLTPEKNTKDSEEPFPNDSPPPYFGSLGPHGGIYISATVTCEGKTGVEMEALTAVVGAGLTVVDMCKGVDRGLVLGGVRVVRKEGGRSGDWGVEGY